MIKISALHFLLLIELLFAIAGAAVFLFLRGRKYSALYRSSMKDLKGALHEKENLQKQAAGIEAKAPKQAEAAGDAAAGAAVAGAAAAGDAVAADAASVTPAKAANEHEKCKIELTILEEKLKEKTKLLNELQSKFDELEKEYLILYRQQQMQQGNIEKT